MKADMSEKGLETLIVDDLIGSSDWTAGDPNDFDREFAIDPVHLSGFLQATQPKVAHALDLGSQSPTRQKFLARLQGEITRRGVVDVLRKGVKHGAHDVNVYASLPSPENERA